MKNRAFTLIEILVVVLIIGILAAIAVPQYQKAVVKSRMVQLQTRVNAIYKAAKVYELTHGTWPTDVRLLDIDITKEAVSFRKDTYMTAFDHMAAVYEDDSICGTFMKEDGKGYIWCRNKDINFSKFFIKDQEADWACYGITDIGTEVCASFNSN